MKKEYECSEKSVGYILVSFERIRKYDQKHDSLRTCNRHGGR